MPLCPLQGRSFQSATFCRFLLLLVAVAIFPSHLCPRQESPKPLPVPLINTRTAAGWMVICSWVLLWPGLLQQSDQCCSNVWGTNLAHWSLQTWNHRHRVAPGLLHGRRLARHEAPTGHLVPMASSRPLAAHPQEIPSHRRQQLQWPPEAVFATDLTHMQLDCCFQAEPQLPPLESTRLVAVFLGRLVPRMLLLLFLLPLLLLLLLLLLLVPHLCLHFVGDRQAAVCKEWVEGALAAVVVLGLQES
mmetsp:Transcript_130024/g.253268  ORF Transcript_130024/g.253268 Transcript_130024/m.253268 type:complete len:246 (+) Transcript_130024:79-816(+)